MARQGRRSQSVQSERNEIAIRGAREHNLRDVSLTLPKHKLIVMTGVSGSGKSSLAFDTLYAEGQRRYVESLSSYARQFLGQMPRPDVDSITGLAPSISIQQKTSGRNPRSTVGTITEIYDYLRVLYARAGTQVCPQCERPITAQSTEQIIDTIGQLEDGTRFMVLAPLIQGQKGEYRDLFDDLLKQGFVRARVDGRIVQLASDLRLDKQMRHTIEVVIDRLTAGRSQRARLAEAVEQALRQGRGTLIVSRQAEDGPTDESVMEDGDVPNQLAEDTDQLFSSDYACTHCGLSFTEPSPQLFSFNSPQGMCQECNGLGERFEFQLASLVADEKKSLWAGALHLPGSIKGMGRWKRHIFAGVAAAIEEDLQLESGSFLKTPWEKLRDQARQCFLNGLGDRHITFSYGHRGGTWKHGGTWSGLFAQLLDDYRKTNNPMRRKQLEKYMTFVRCSSCHGLRLNGQALAVRLTGPVDDQPIDPKPTGKKAAKKTTRRGKPAQQAPLLRALNIADVCALDIEQASRFFTGLELNDTQHMIAAEVIKEIRGRLGFLLRCGLNYLTLDRTAPTLSGGESQRIRLAGQIGCGLVDVVYILDEPSIGLHPRDNQMLLDSLCELRDQGNTVIVVEHDEDTMLAADQIIDFGPGPGVRGGEVVAVGTVDDIRKCKASLTGQYLSGVKSIPVPRTRRPVSDKRIAIRGASHHNLRNVDVDIPVGAFVCVTGVSGSGKSSLINDILWEVLNRDVNQGNGSPGEHAEVLGLEHIDKAIAIDQSPIGRTPRSNPATYVKLFDLIRDLFTQLPESKLRGYKPGRFSFNVPGGRCEHCEGHGATKLEMDFLADIWVTCPICNGRRFQRETLEVRFKGRSIADILEMDIQDGLTHFENVPRIRKLLQTLHDVGLDYLKLGQPSPTLSGGEAQRIKLARELGKRSTGSTIYLLDEPTTGLHFADVDKLLEVLHGFVDEGNTVLVVEHNLDVIKTADWVIDVGPDGGAGGGQIVATGTPDDIAKCLDSFTGEALAPLLGIKRRASKVAASAAAARETLLATLNHAAASPDRTGASRSSIAIRGARQHNLQDLSVEIPREQMNVFCGPSGSGKTSLAMDTLYAEGQRRYVESLSAYARQFLGQMPKPRVEHIHGLQPAIAIEQKTVGSTPRSTVGTVTEIYDYLRILWCRLGTQHCPDCGCAVATQTTDQVIERLMGMPEGTRLLLLAPQEVRVGQLYARLWESLIDQGFARVRIDGTTCRLEEVPDIDRKRKHDVEVVVDRVTIRPNQRARIAESVGQTLQLGHGVMRVAAVDGTREEPEWKVDTYSLFRVCEQCGRSFEELTPNNFSFNSPLGWCPDCEGIGSQQGTDLGVLINDTHRPLREAAVSIWPDYRESQSFACVLDALAQGLGFDPALPFARLEPAQRRALLHGTGDRWFDVPAGHTPAFRFQFQGLFPAIEEAARVSYAHRRRLVEMVGHMPCLTCDGSRLRDDAGSVRYQGFTLQQVCDMPLRESYELLKGIRLVGSDRKVAADLLDEARHRMSFLVEVGLEYLTLDRGLPTLSGGETQRIRLAGQIGRALTGVLYVLDEPTIGLHPRDNARLIGALTRLRDLGNTLVLVEHDREVISNADRVFDFGPGSGRHGGTITDSGTPKQLAASKVSLTGSYLGGSREIVVPEARRMNSTSATSSEDNIPPGGGWLSVIGARLHNLRQVDLHIPLGTLTVVTGVSGSGKSSLVEDTLARALLKILHRASEQPGPHTEIQGLKLIDKAIVVDQAPLGTTPKSNPGTYTGVLDHIRDLFARLPDAKVRGYAPGRFSFNRPGGRCDACEGDGQTKIEMHFLPDVWIECESCHGRRFNQETLNVKYHGHSIADVLNLSIGQALELFGNIPKIRKPLATLAAIGLDYLTLGQSATTLSGGEAQRVKLAAELARPNTGRTIYILDEPTTGLHFDDIEKLLHVLESLVEAGNTVVVIEHNLDVIKVADWVVEVGPEAGSSGGQIVAVGTPEDIVKHAQQWQKQSGKMAKLLRCHTGEQLEVVLRRSRRGRREAFDAQAEGAKRKGDLSLADVGRDARMPWEVDGRRWHLAERISHSGKACRWEGDALDFVVKYVTGTENGPDHVESAAGNNKPEQGVHSQSKKKTARSTRGRAKAALRKASELLAEQEGQASDSDGETTLRLKTNWNDASTVEVTGDEQRLGWFLHALTRDEWLLKLCFRVERGCFDEQELSARLALKSVDDMSELPVYGRTNRVRVTNKPAGYQEVVITVHWLKEIDTPEFRQFMREARDSYCRRVATAPVDPADVEPWKVLGKKWHLLAKGFPAGKRPQWTLSVLESVLSRLESIFSADNVVWNERQFVRFQRRDDNSDRVVVCTKRRAGIDITVKPASGDIGTGDVASVVSGCSVQQNDDGALSITLRITSQAEADAPELNAFLERCRDER